MDDEKKDVKVRRSITLKPINDSWLENQALAESVPGDQKSVSELIDRLIDQARQNAESPSSKKNNKKSAQALEIVAA